MPTYVVRLWLPDRPGTLGQVAAAIGSADADVIGIEILERGAGMAIDELMVSVPEGRSADDVVAALAKVDGVAVEDVHSIAATTPSAITP
jgi:UTP:GlnB (protein PII) uridylyltransferase